MIMMFGLDEDIYNENKIEKIELNCPLIITVPSGASHDLMLTKLIWSFEYSFWLTASFYPIDNPVKQIILENKKKLLLLLNFSSL